MVKLLFGCHFFFGAKLSALLCWCQIVLVPNCPGAKLSGAKLSGAKLSYNLITDIVCLSVPWSV